MSANVPWNVNAKGIVGKPAAPTLAPGGSVAAAACVAAAGVAELAAVAVADEPAGAEFADEFAAVPSSNVRMSTLEPRAADCSW
jgi:hypothetical protein